MTDRLDALVTALRLRIEHLQSGVRIGQFVSVGGVGFLVDNLVLALAHDLADLSLAPAKIVGAEAAIVVMFALNERWTFADAGSSRPGAILRRFLTSNAVRVGGVGVATGVLLALNQWFGVWYLAANVVGIGVGFVVNYVMESLVTWRVHRREIEAHREE